MGEGQALQSAIAGATQGAVAPWSSIVGLFQPQGTQTRQTQTQRSDAGFFAVMGIAILGALVITALILKK
jgi:hypothetical protein